MAKKKASGFVLAAEIKKLIQANPKLKEAEAYESLTKSFPKEKIKRNSFQVAFYTARKNLGLSPKKRKKTKGKKVVVRKTPVRSQAVSLSALQAAAKFVSEVGDAQTAIEAVRQLRDLQIR
ncbi:MAG: hypothetical protein Tsb009_21590 [Planctomycetaceae bacterium]